METKIETKQVAKTLVLYDDIVKGLRDVGIEEGDTLFVHTSLGKMGFVMGGPETLIRGLLEVVGPEGTIMMPSQTWKNLDPSTGVHWEEPEDWWPLFREHWPAYDKEVTPAIGMGIVAEMFRKWPGAKRSDHPARSVAAVGKYADYLTTGHDLSNIFGPGSPVDKFYELNGKVLLLGVGYDKNTSLHLAETRASFKSKAYTTESSAILIGGKRQWVDYETQAVDDVDFIPLGEAFEKACEVKSGRVGDANIRAMRQRDLVDFAVKWMEAHR